MVTPAMGHQITELVRRRIPAIQVADVPTPMGEKAAHQVSADLEERADGALLVVALAATAVAVAEGTPVVPEVSIGIDQMTHAPVAVAVAHSWVLAFFRQV